MRVPIRVTFICLQIEMPHLLLKERQWRLQFDPVFRSNELGKFSKLHL